MYAFVKEKGMFVATQRTEVTRQTKVVLNTVLRIRFLAKFGSRALYLERREILKFYGIIILDLENQSGSVNIRT